MPGRKMQNIQKGSKGIARHVPDLRLIHKSLVEEIGRVLLFHFVLFSFSLSVLFCALFLFDAFVCLHSGSRDVESHFDQLIGASCSLLSTVLCATSRLLAGLVAIGIQGEFHRDLVFPGKVRIRDFGVWDFEGRAVLHVERQLGLGELCLAPVPASERSFPGFHIDAIPILECFAQPFQVLKSDRYSVRNCALDGVLQVSI